MTIILLIISFLFGLMISIVVLINTIKSKLFYKECPFNISLAHLNHVFRSYYGTIPEDNHIKDSCKNRRCILDSIDSNDDYPYNYLCNYDPIDDFKNDKDIYIRNLPNDTIIQTKVSFATNKIKLTAVTGCDDSLLNQVPVAAIRNRANKAYPHSIVLSKDALIDDYINKIPIIKDYVTKINPNSYKFQLESNFKPLLEDLLNANRLRI